MENKIAIITGGSRGIGRAIAQKFHDEGYEVIILARSAFDDPNFTFYKCDLSDLNQISNAITDIYSKFETIDVLVNNAGITKDNLMLSMSLEDFEQVIQTNLTSVFYISKLVSKKMLKKRQGKIINISSVVGIHGNAGQSNYAASKAGLIGLTKSMAKEFASRNIQVNAVAPGFIDTDMTAKLSEEQREMLKSQIPLKRMGQPEDVANLVHFLASQHADYITGQVISVCGGMSI